MTGEGDQDEAIITLRKQYKERRDRFQGHFRARADESAQRRALSGV